MAAGKHQFSMGNPAAAAALGGRYSDAKYFASNQTLIFIGPYLLDEALACQYSFQQSKVPIYGYNDQYYRAVGAGKIFVQGSLTINYIDSNYLYWGIAQALQKGQNSRGLSSYQEVVSSIDTFGARGKKIRDMLGKLSDPTPSGVTPKPLPAKDLRQIAQIIATDTVNGPIVMDQLKDLYWQGAGVLPDIMVSSLSDNAYTGNLTPADFAGLDPSSWNNLLKARPDQAPPVNITVSHGNPLDKDFSTFRVLREVEFTGVTQQMSPTGQVQTETYSFFCRNVDF